MAPDCANVVFIFSSKNFWVYIIICSQYNIKPGDFKIIIWLCVDFAGHTQVQKKPVLIKSLHNIYYQTLYLNSIQDPGFADVDFLTGFIL